ncbi:hypothetical protein [Actinoallomurus sp. CA-142502]|uniref:hypothetical protein n=1 Tax=Actinoallomurus sp. CA-142502 TaxID=3239885 RepID=UPI003D94EDA5
MDSIRFRLSVPPGLGPRHSESVERLSEWPLPQRFSAMQTALFLQLDERFRIASRSIEPTVRGERASRALVPGFAHHRAAGGESVVLAQLLVSGAVPVADRAL